MNRWQVYEYLKQAFMFSGKVPTREAVFNRFKQLPEDEINEGIIEFMMTTKKAVRSAKGA